MKIMTEDMFCQLRIWMQIVPENNLHSYAILLLFCQMQYLYRFSWVQKYKNATFSTTV